MSLIRPLTILYMLLSVSLLHLAAQTNVTGDGAAFQAVVKGKVSNNLTGSPVPDHLVFVIIDSIGVSDTLATDVNGFYSDTIPDVPGPGIPIFVGTFDCHQVMHSQTVMSLPTPVTVNFSICDSGSPVECEAEFKAALDTFNHSPNTFRFTDLSTGGPDLWFWNFGDGDVSVERNPVHRYSQPGTFKVCLTIVSNGEGKSNCTDSICHDVTTQKYLNLGGLVFAGGTPVNNPEPRGDTGVAYLYFIIDEQIVPYDTNRFSYLGYYTFPNVLPGEYLLKVELTQGSEEYGDWFPTYYSSSLAWKEASGLQLTDNVYDAAVHLVAVQDTLSGEGLISGQVIQGESSGYGELLDHQQVMLLTQDQLPLTFTFSDQEGNFGFSGLPYNHYLLKVETPGKYSGLVPVSLTADDPVVSGMVLERFDHDVTGIGTWQGGDTPVATLYPNPASGKINIRFNQIINGEYSALIYGSQGIIRRFSWQGGTGHSMSLEGLPSGFYILEVRNQEGHFLFAGKFVKMF